MNLPYLTHTKPLNGELKRRIEDFVVEEILPNGEICKIEQLNRNPPPRFQQEIPENTNPKKWDQLHVRMEKFNLETTFAIRQLSRGINSSIKRIGYAGLKDKRAVTCQRISLWKPDVEKIKKFGVRGIALHHAEWSDKRIELGDLRGNQFVITIRNIPHNEEKTRKIIDEFWDAAKQGLPNYYGEQRFGGYRKITHVVGKLLLENKIEEAVMTYLTKETEGEEEEIKMARKNVAETKDFSAALNEFPDKLHFEKTMLHHLHVNPRDFTGAFLALPRQTRYLFTHAYQSHVFNEIIAERVKRGITYAIEGDVLENGIPTAPLPGIRTIFAKGLAGEIEQNVLQREGVEPSFFGRAKIGELSSWGARKPILLQAHELKILGAEKDELFEGKTKAVVSFWLEKGMYATTVLRELTKNDDE